MHPLSKLGEKVIRYTTKKLRIFVIFNRYFWTSTYHHYVLERLGNVIMACLSTLTLFFDCATRPSSLKVALACGL